MKNEALILSVLLCIHGCFSNNNDDNELDLINHLLNTKNYNKRVRPVLDPDQPVVVKHGITLTELSDINEIQQKMIVSVLQKIEWKDELLHWNPDDFGGQEEITINLSNFWAPELLLYNNADENYPIMNHDHSGTKVILRSDGNITWISPGILKSSCKINVKYFPLDEQICTLRIGSWTYGVDKLDIYPSRNEIDLSMYSNNGQWELVDTVVHRETLIHTCCTKNVAEIVYYVHLRRLPLFYITNFIMPCALLAALTAMVFGTPAETGEQLAVGVTILLALVVFFLMVESQVPNTSDHLPLIAKYYCCTVVEIAAVLAVTCIIHKFEHHDAVPLPAWIKKYIIGYMGKLVFMKFAAESKLATKSETSLQARAEKGNKLSWPTKDQVTKMLHSKNGPSPFDNNPHLKMISQSMQEDKESEEQEMQWKHAANILARFMIFVYLFAITITFFGTLLAREKRENVFDKP